MSRLLVIGGTGYAGAFIAKEAQKRNHTVIVLSRSKAYGNANEIEYVQGSATDTNLLENLIKKSDVVVAAVSPRGDMVGKVVALYSAIAQLAAKHNVRLIIVGGFSSLRPAAGAARFFEDGSIPAEYRDEALELASVLQTLESSAPEDLDWLFVSPAAEFGAYAKVTDTGTYQVGGDVAIFNEKGESKISGADFAIGIVDEIEANQHRNSNISIAQL